MSSFRPPARFDRDACGIGLVADVEGRASRSLVDSALVGLACVRHRSAVAADGISGDGAGLLLPIPQAFFARVAREAGLAAPGGDPRLGVVTAFLDAADDGARRIAEQTVADACAAEGLVLLGWRPVPIDDTLLGAAARRSAPHFTQAILACPADNPDGRPADLERRCFRARRRAEAACRAAGVRHYFASWSFATVVYKALVMSDGLSGFYPDLAASDFEAPLAVFHSRFSTNTTPAWERAQPFRYLCHNGEINTLRGNEHRMAARGRLGTEEAGLGPEELFSPLLDPEDSDSGKLDAAVNCSSRAGATSATPWPCSSPRPGKAAGTCRPRSATSSATTPAWPSPGTARPASSSPMAAGPAPPSTATGCGRCASRSATTVSWSARPRSGRCPSPATARCGGAGSAPARCSASTPTGAGS